MGKGQFKQSWIENYSQLLSERRTQIRPLIPDDGYKYRMLDKQCAEVLVAGIDHMWQVQLQLFSTDYDESASLNATFFALVLALF
jgi:hypothetical protein